MSLNDKQKGILVGVIFTVFFMFFISLFMKKHNKKQKQQNYLLYNTNTPYSIMTSTSTIGSYLYEGVNIRDFTRILSAIPNATLLVDNYSALFFELTSATDKIQRINGSEEYYIYTIAPNDETNMKIYLSIDEDISKNEVYVLKFTPGNPNISFKLIQQDNGGVLILNTEHSLYINIITDMIVENSITAVLPDTDNTYSKDDTYRYLSLGEEKEVFDIMFFKTLPCSSSSTPTQSFFNK